VGLIVSVYTRLHDLIAGDTQTMPPDFLRVVAARHSQAVLRNTSRHKIIGLERSQCRRADHKPEAVLTRSGPMPRDVEDGLSEQPVWAGKLPLPTLGRGNRGYTRLSWPCLSRHLPVHAANQMTSASEP
jgi:hypothetical protein